LRERKPAPSDAYQWRFAEISVDPALLADTELPGLGQFLAMNTESEEFRDLKEQLLTEVMRLVRTRLTPNQGRVVALTLAGRTQAEIAQQLGCHQTSVHKCLKGNIDYRYPNGPRRHGGAIKRLQVLCAKDKKVCKILEEMKKLRDEEDTNE